MLRDSTRGVECIRGEGSCGVDCEPLILLIRFFSSRCGDLFRRCETNCARFAVILVYSSTDNFSKAVLASSDEANTFPTTEYIRVQLLFHGPRTPSYRCQYKRKTN